MKNKMNLDKMLSKIIDGAIIFNLLYFGGHLVKASLEQSKENAEASQQAKLRIEQPVGFEQYVVKPGDISVHNLACRFKNKYNIPKDVYEYRENIREFNPKIGSRWIIHPGDTLKIPIYAKK